MRSRKLIRLQGYDYTRSGVYFITICTKDRIHYFGEVYDGIMIMNEIGKYCYDEIKSLSEKRKNVEIGEFVIMPNHVHIIVIIKPYCRDVSIMRPLNNPIMYTGNDNIDGLNNDEDGLLNRPYMGPLLGSIIKLMKGNIKKYATENNLSFNRQPRFHDHIIRNESEYKRIQQYIIDNQKNRDLDTFYS